MKIAIASPYQMECPSGPLAFDGGTSRRFPPWEWHDWVFNGLYPWQIQEKIQKELDKEEEKREEWEKPVPELHLVTLNQTVLNMVRSDGQITYEDVFVFDNKTEKLVPLLEAYDSDSVLQVRLGEWLEMGRFNI